MVALQQKPSVIEKNIKQNERIEEKSICSQVMKK